MAWIILAAANFVCALLSYALLACALASLRWSGRGMVFTIVAIIISAQIWLIPQSISAFVFREKTILDWFWLLDWLCCCFSIILLWQALKETSSAHAEAARIDGCGAVGVFWHIVLPLVRSTLFFLGILILIGNAGYFLARPSEILGAGAVGLNWLFLAGASIGMTIVPIAVFLFARKLFPPRKF